MTRGGLIALLIGCGILGLAVSGGATNPISAILYAIVAIGCLVMAAIIDNNDRSHR